LLSGEDAGFTPLREAAYAREIQLSVVVTIDQRKE
jgi:hypothetical protein